MEKITQNYIGVDVSKKQLDVYIYPTEKLVSFVNSEDGIIKMIQQFSGYSVEQIVCESTGGYEDLMIKMLRKKGYKVWQVEPNRIKSFIRSKGRKAKTDAIDARMIALFAAQETPEHDYVDYGKNTKLIHDLVKRKQDLTAIVTTEKQRLKHPSQVNCVVEIKELIDFLNNQIKNLSDRIQRLIDEDDQLSKKAKIIESVPGVGKATAAMLIAELPELGSTENKKIASLVGVAPYTQQSGQYKGKAFISGGRKTVRSAIYMAALVASRYNTPLKEFYRRLCDISKKPPKVALVAVMRKLVTILNTMVKNKTTWSC